MDTKQLVDKFINGEISETEFDAETAKLSPEDKVKLDNEAKTKLPDAVEKLKGVRRGIDKIADTHKADDASLAAKLKQENLVSAKTKFFNDFGIEKEEDRKAFEEGFQTESINVENIMKDMKTRYVAMNPDKYLNLEKELKNREKNAEEYNAENAGGGNGSGAGGDNLTKVSKEVKEHIANTLKLTGRTISPEQAERALKIKNQRGHIA
jgi:hypothetical protein